MEAPVLIVLAAVILGGVWLLRRRAAAPARLNLGPAVSWTLPADLPEPEPGWLYCALTCTPVGDDRWWVSLRHYDLDGLRHYERSPEQVSGRAVSDRRRQLAAQGWDEILCTQDGARLLCAYRRGA